MVREDVIYQIKENNIFLKEFLLLVLLFCLTKCVNDTPSDKLRGDTKLHRLVWNEINILKRQNLCLGWPEVMIVCLLGHYCLNLAKHLLWYNYYSYI